MDKFDKPWSAVTERSGDTALDEQEHPAGPPMAMKHPKRYGNSYRTPGLLPLLILLCCTFFSHAVEPTAGYLMGYFTESTTGRGDSWNLQIAVSEDGLDWMPLNQNEPVLVSSVGQKGIRDPFFLRKPEGGFVVLATDLTGKKMIATPNIFACDTKDFITFENPRLLKLHDTAMWTQAPEAFFDPARNEYSILWTGDAGYHRIYVNHTRDFVNVGPSEIYFDPGHDVRDATLATLTAPAGNFLYYRDGEANRVRGSRSASLAASGFSETPYAKPPGQNLTEAPLLIPSRQENRWFLYAESNDPVNAEFYAWETDDLTQDSWKEISKRDFNPPLNAKHATVLPITRGEMDRLIARWGKPKWNRLKSWNYPDCYLRHELMLAKISEYPFDPYQDSQWILVPGLAEADGVSFESVNYPGYYLLRVAEHVRLSKYEDSAEFRERATFMKVPGLANPAWSSFHALGSPDLYLRHASYHLRVESLSTQGDKEDATFRVVY